MKKILLIVSILLAAVVVVYVVRNNTEKSPSVSSAPDVETVKEEREGDPIIYSISPDKGPVGTVVKISGKHLNGFEGDLDVTFERADGKKIFLNDKTSYRETGGDFIVTTIKEPCQAGETVYGAYSGDPSPCNFVPFTPGPYKVYATPWGKTSNSVIFTVTK